MKKNAILILSLALAGWSSVWGQNPPAATPAAPPAAAAAALNLGPAKLGFINLERALSEVQEGKQLFGELQTYIDQKNKELEDKRNEIAKKEQQLRAQEKTLSDETKIELQKELDERRTQLTRFQEDTAKEIERRQNVNVQKIGQKMQPLIQAYAKDRNLTAIVIWSPQLYAYVDESVNVTDEIIKRYDSSHPMAAPPAKKP